MYVTINVISCKKNQRKEEIAIILKEWIGKEIIFPENISYYISDKKSIPDMYNEYFEKEFKVFLYVDSSGCTNCRLRLSGWKSLIEEADSLFHEKMGFILFLQPKNNTDLSYSVIKDNFDYPVFLDMEGKIKDLNNLPQKAQYQCFLLDKDNKVLIVGNPVLNFGIWELYKKQIESGIKTRPLIMTSVFVDKTVHDFKIISKGSSKFTVFTITNNGNHPLVIHRVDASCGCTHVNWEKQPVQSGQATSIKVEMKPEEIGYFHKTIDVYCNTDESPIKFSITGLVD